MGLDAIIGNMSNIVLPQIAQERLDRLQTRTARIGVIGLGYVGLPLSLLLSEAGFKVSGFDIDASKVDALEAGRSYIFRIEASEIQAARAKGFSATTEFARLSDQDAIILCVPTPLTEHHEPDLSYVENTAKAAAPWIREGQLVVLESTTYPGTTEELMIPVLEAGNTLGLKIRAILPWHGEIFPRSSADMRRLPPNWRQLCTRESLPAPCVSRRPAWRR